MRCNQPGYTRPEHRESFLMFIQAVSKKKGLNNAQYAAMQKKEQ